MKLNFLYQITAAFRTPDQGAIAPQIPILCLQMNLLNPPPRTKFLGTPVIGRKMCVSLREQQIMQVYSYTHRAYGPGSSGIITNCFHSEPPAGERVQCSMEIAGYCMILLQILSMTETFPVPSHYSHVTTATVQCDCMQRISTSQSCYFLTGTRLLCAADSIQALCFGCHRRQMKQIPRRRQHDPQL